MENIKKTTKKTTIVVETYHLSNEIKYCITYTNNKETERTLKYLGEKINNYGLSVIYKEDLSLLKTTNPFWDNYDWFKTDKLPNVEDIDFSKIILIQSVTHSFFTIDKEPIPVYHVGDYCGANLDNEHYDLVALKSHLDIHPNVKYVSEILDIPYYNRTDNKTKYLKIGVYPTKECLQKAVDNNIPSKDIVFGNYLDIDGYDFLNIKQFLIK